MYDSRTKHSKGKMERNPGGYYTMLNVVHYWKVCCEYTEVMYCKPRATPKKVETEMASHRWR